VAKNALLGGNIHAIADISPTVQLLELTVTEESPMRGYTLSELELPADARLLGFGKAGGRMNLPEPDQSLELGDRVIVIADYDVLNQVRQIIVGQANPVAAAGGV
jgi:trk system potassium uptake protein TrkA